MHVVLVTARCSCHYMLEKGVCGPGEIVAGIVLFQNQLPLLGVIICEAAIIQF